MCGINLILNRRGQPIDGALLQRANQALLHRGPDEEASWTHGPVGLGARRLSIIDVSGGHQPLTNENGRVIMVYNGEIYNHHELRTELLAAGHQFKTKSDGEVITHLYEQDPLHFVEKLDGMFAFILFDTEQKRLLLARDRMGIKPLFVFMNDSWILASSEAKGIFATGLVSCSLNHQALFDSFTFGFAPGWKSIFQDIEHLPPAHLLQIDIADNSTRLHEYWQPRFISRTQSKRIQFGSYVSELQNAFPKSVESQRMSDVAIGAYLSGGIDSSLTALMLQRVLPDKLRSFSIQFTDNDFDESEIFTKTARMLQFQPEILKVENITALHFAKVLKYLEQPQYSPLDVPLFQLSGLVRSTGTKVVLTGEGSDEIFGGYIVFALAQLRRLLTVPALARFKVGLLTRVLKYYVRETDEQQRLRTVLLSDLRHITDRFGTVPAWYPMWLSLDALKADLFLEEGDYTPSFGEGSSFHKLCLGLIPQMKNLDDFHRSILIEFKTRLPNYILSRTDKNSMANSVEARVPFLSNDMVDVACSIPAWLKLLGMKEKFILRSAFKKDLPAHIVKMKKRGFNAPNRWLWQSPDDFSRDMLSESMIKKTGIFNYSKVEQLLREVQGQPWAPDNNRVQLVAHLLTGVLSCQVLHSTFVEKQSF